MRICGKDSCYVQNRHYTK